MAMKREAATSGFEMPMGDQKTSFSSPKKAKTAASPAWTGEEDFALYSYATAKGDDKGFNWTEASQRVEAVHNVKRTNDAVRHHWNKVLRVRIEKFVIRGESNGGGGN